MDNKQINSAEHQGKLELIATQRVSSNSELYKIVDFLNRNLKDYRLMFGLTKKADEMVISVYDVE